MEGAGAPRIGLALGGGGAKGLAHIPLLETFDALRVRPAALAGSSIGAVLAAVYASGTSGAEIRAGLDAFLFAEGENGTRGLLELSSRLRRIFDLVDFELGSGGFVRGEKFVSFLYDEIRVARFEDLEIPLQVVATDFWTREAVVFESGELLPAIRASMSLPALFTPVVIGERVLMDGGTVNPVPYDLLWDRCDLTVAVDVAGRRTPPPERIPSLFDSIFTTFQIMSKAIVDEKLGRRPPDLLLRPDIVDVQMLEFGAAHRIYAQTEPSCRELRAWLEARLAGRSDAAAIRT
jgi:NTE family protein